MYIFIYVYIYIYIRPRALSPEGSVSDALDGSLAILALVLSTLKGPQERLPVFSLSSSWISTMFFFMFLLSHFVIDFLTPLVRFSGQHGPNMAPRCPQLGAQNGSKIDKNR